MTQQLLRAAACATLAAPRRPHAQRARAALARGHCCASVAAINSRAHASHLSSCSAVPAPPESNSTLARTHTHACARRRPCSAWPAAHTPFTRLCTAHECQHSRSRTQAYKHKCVREQCMHVYNQCNARRQSPAAHPLDATHAGSAQRTQVQQHAAQRAPTEPPLRRRAAPPRRHISGLPARP